MQFAREMWASFRGLPVLAQVGIVVAFVTLGAVSGGALDQAEEEEPEPVSTPLTLPQAVTTTKAPTTTSTTLPPTTTIAPTTTRATTAATAPATTAVYYANCTEARAAGAAPIRRGQPGYGTHLDRDRDGIGCDT